MFRNQPFLHYDEAAANLPGLAGTRKPQGPNLRVLCGLALAGALVLMLSAAMTGLLVRALLQADQGVRIVFTGSFLAFLALLTAAAYTAYAERQHELRLAQYDEKRQMYCRLANSLFSVLDAYNGSGCFDPHELTDFLEQYETELVACGDHGSIRPMGRPLQQTVHEGPTQPVLRRYK